MSKTTIEWTERTWNPVRGCSPVSPGCANCYAERQGGRFCGLGQPFDGFIQIGKNGNPGPHWTGKVDLIEHMLDVPLRTRKPTTWFVNSMSDLFHEELPDEAIDRVFAVMALCPQHTFQVLTKRSRRMREYFTAEIPLSGRDELVAAQAAHTGKIVWDARGSDRHAYFGCGQIGDISNRRVWPGWPLPNVWLGVSVEDQQRADERIPDLLQTPAAVRFISAEPLLGPVDLTNIEFRRATWYNALEDHDGFGLLVAAHLKLDWVIVGGESGPNARPFDTQWARIIVRQCNAAGVRCFVKQLGAHVIQGGERRKKKSKKGGDMHEWEHDLRVRQTPVLR